MIKQSIIIMLLAFSFTTVFSQNAEIKLVVKGISVGKGTMSIGMYNNEEDYSSKDGKYYFATTDVVDSTYFECIIKNVEAGNYAIKIYHDVDSNGELNTNWMGMPKEPFGFSNDAKGTFGPPKFEDAVFELNGDKEIVINLIEL